MKNQLVSRAITTAVGGSSSSASSGTTSTGSEVEPNDTFLSSLSSSSGFNNNGLGVSNGNSFILSATISSNTDIDIFDSSNGSGGSRTITQTNNLDKVTCNIYLKNNSLERNNISRLQTTTSTPTSDYIFQGKLNPSFSFSYVSGGSVVYTICNGMANTAYSIKIDATASAGGTSSTISALSTLTDYSFISSCSSATKTCETKCSRSF